jgi:hypothetical protein
MRDPALRARAYRPDFQLCVKELQMQRVNRSSAVLSLPAAPAGGTPGYFTGGNPGLGQQATVPGYEWFNGVQEELIGMLTRAGVTPAQADVTQLRQSLDRLYGGALRSVAANITLTADDAGLVMVDASGGARTITLPAASAMNARPMLFRVVKIDTSANAVTVQRAGTDTIEGATSIVVNGQWASAVLVSNGANAWVRTPRFATAAEVDAGSLANVGVTPAGLGIATRSFGASGYQRLPGGLILQWGRQNWAAAQLPDFSGAWSAVAPILNVPVTWPIAFPNGIWAAFGNGSDITGGNDGLECAVAVGGLSNSGATFRVTRISGSHGGTDVGAVFFFAVGN